jgi:hypothetical protein
LDYRTYAGIRATTGRDVAAVLFSSNALELHMRKRAVAAELARKLAPIDAHRIGLAAAPLSPADMLELVGLDAAFLPRVPSPPTPNNASASARLWAGLHAIRRFLWGPMGPRPNGVLPHVWLVMFPQRFIFRAKPRNFIEKRDG